MRGKSVFKLLLVLTGLFLLTFSTFSFRRKDPSTPLENLVKISPQLRVVETNENFLNIKERFMTEEAVIKFLSENRGDWYVFIDKRRGVPSLIDGGAIPFIPGEANDLKWADFNAKCNSIQCIPKEKVEELARDFLKKYEGLFGVKNEELIIDKEGTLPIWDSIYLIRFQWYMDGIPVEKGSIFFRINNGNLIQIASENVSPKRIDTKPYISRKYAFEILNSYLGEFAVSEKDTILNDGSLIIIPVTPAGMDPNVYEGPIGTMIDYKLAYRFIFRKPEIMGTWEALIDAHTGELIRFVDANRYGSIRGGVYKTDKNPTQTEEVMPFPYADYGSNQYADIAGNFPGTTGTSTMTGRTGSAGNVGSVRINDNCGSISLSADSNGVINFGTSGGTDCTTPGYGGAGNTHSARTQYFNVAWIKIKAYTYLTGNSWLQGLLQDNVNINQACNAYWNGTSINFFRYGSYYGYTCGNTGELPGVSLHEWGHGMDDNDGSGGDSPPVETRADFTAILQTHQSCAGGGFFLSSLGCGVPPSQGSPYYNCDGYGDCCLDCSGIRDADWDKHASHTPWTIANYGTVWSGCDSGSYFGPCGKEDHCESGISTQALWDLATRDLITYCGMDITSAWQLVDRLWYSSMPQMGDMYTCTPPTSNGCGSTSLFNLFRAIDDDGDGTSNGTPHAQAIFQAFNRHMIACGNANDQSNQNQTSCPSLSTPTLNGTAGSNSVNLSWNAVTNATRYFIFRNDTSCDSGFTRIAVVNAPTTTYTDTACVNGITSYYRIQAATNNDSCISPMSNCVAVTPQPCAGSISLPRSTFNCNDSVTVTVLDSSAPNPPFQCEAWSTSDPTHRYFTVDGVPSTYTGVFTTTTGTPGPGQVKVSHGDTLYIRYVDPDYCGTPNVNVDVTATIDCMGPIISNVNANVSGVTATITWSTDEPSTSKVYYRPIGSSTFSSVSNFTLTTSHSIVIGGLSTCTKYQFYVESTDSAMNTSIDNNNGNYYTFVTGLLYEAINEDFSNGIPNDWTVIDGGTGGGNASTWTTSNPCNRVGTSPIVAPFAIVDSDCAGSSATQDEELITPALDLSDATTVILEFDQYFYYYSSGSNEVGDVDVRSSLTNNNWVNVFRNQGSSSSNPDHQTIDISPYAAGATNVQIRFHYYNGSYEWYWMIDNIKVTASGVCASSAGTIELDDSIYVCNNDLITVTIRDTDLIGSATAYLTTSQGDSETVICYETGAGVFTGTIYTANLPRILGDGYLQVANGETITATYYDADDGSGNPATVQDFATTDCLGPTIANVQVTNITGTSATITWTTNEEANSVVTYGTSIPPTSPLEDLSNYVTSHSMTLTNLTPCTTYYFSVTSTDRYGNSTTDNNLGLYYNFTTLNDPVTIFSENFNNVTPPNLPAGWTTEVISGNAWDTNSSGCTGNALRYPYNYSQQANSWVFTPAITLEAGVTYTLSFNQKVYSSSYPEKMEIKCGNAPNSSAMSITIMSEQQYTNTTCILRSYEFTVPTTGTYYIGFHCTSAANMFYLYVDDVSITRPGSCIPDIVYTSHSISDVCTGGQGDNNGIVEPGEIVTISINVTNLGGSATGVVGTLSCSTNGVTILDNTATFPNIPPQGSAQSNSPHFQILVDQNISCLTDLNFTLNVKSNENQTGTNSYFTIKVGQEGQSAQVYSENFTGITPPNLPSGWTTVVISGNAWQTTSSYYCNASPSLAYRYHSTQAADSWAFTPAIYLESGRTYTLSFNQRVASSLYPEKFEVKCGTSATPNGQTITIFPVQTYTNTTCTLRSSTFTVPSSGNYYIGFHCTSDADMYYLVIDDINLTYQTDPICNTCTTNVSPPGEVAPGDNPSNALIFTDNNTLTWAQGSGNIIGYRVYRGIRSNLPALLDNSSDFCLRAETTNLSINVSTDDPSSISDRCYYYLVTAYNNGGEGSAGFASGNIERVLNSSGNCQ